MAAVLFLVWLFSLVVLRREMGRTSSKPKFSHIFSKSRSVNILSAARLFLFAARDVWFVVALPVYLAATLGWKFQAVGGFMALWVIGYGLVQSVAPGFTTDRHGRTPDGRSAMLWALPLGVVPVAIAFALGQGVAPQASLLPGLLLFGVLFAINSALHSYLIVSYAESEGVSLDVGFYYMANAMGRLLGTVLSGWVFQVWGIVWCLIISGVFIALAAAISLALPRH
jgi:MFS family permease